MRGRKPKPTKLKVLHGNPGKRPINTREPKPRTGRIRCPRWLDKEARAKWREVLPELKRAGIVTVLDGDALAMFCVFWAEFRHALETIRREGRTYKVGDQVKRHPACALAAGAAKELRVWCAEFGLSPAARARLSIPTANDARDEFEQFLAG